MKNYGKKILAAVLAMVTIISTSSILVGAASSPGSVSAYKNLTNNKDAYAKTSTVIGDWNWVWPMPNTRKLSSCYVDYPGHGSIHWGIDIPGPKGGRVSCFFATWEGTPFTFQCLNLLK